MVGARGCRREYKARVPSSHPSSFLFIPSTLSTLDTMALTRGQLGTRSLRSGDVTIKLSKKRLPVGRSHRRTTATLRPRVSIRTDGTQSGVENSTHVPPLYSASSNSYFRGILPAVARASQRSRTRRGVSREDADGKEIDESACRQFLRVMTFLAIFH